MIYYLIVFAIMTYVYIYVTLRKKNIMNLLFYQFVGQGVLVVFLYSLYLYKNNSYYSLRKGELIYLLFVLVSYLGSAYIICSNKRLNLPEYRMKNVSKWIVVCICLFLAVYWLRNVDQIILIIKNPRMFYANSRLGGGFIYYIILPFSLFVYTYFLSVQKIKQHNYINNIKIIAVTLFMIFYLYIFGQKAIVITLFYIILSLMYYKNPHFKINKKILKIGSLGVLVFAFIFILYSRQQNIKVDNLINSLVTYSDYINNFSDLVDNTRQYSYGKVLLQDEIYSYIPRTLWPNKPELFGSLSLGLRVPRLIKWTLAKTGAPSFSIIGATYADFGVFCILIESLKIWIFVFIAKTYEYRLLNVDFNIFDFLMMHAFGGAAIFSLTLVKIPLYQIIVVSLLYLMSNLNFRFKFIGGRL